MLGLLTHVVTEEMIVLSKKDHLRTRRRQKKESYMTGLRYIVSSIKDLITAIQLIYAKELITR